jgi:hypothetical protein
MFYNEIIADPKVKYDLIEARDFLNSRRTGFGKKFLSEYSATLKLIQKTPNFKLDTKIFIVCQ